MSASKVWDSAKMCIRSSGMVVKSFQTVPPCPGQCLGVPNQYGADKLPNSAKMCLRSSGVVVKCVSLCFRVPESAN